MSFGRSRDRRKRKARYMEESPSDSDNSEEPTRKNWQKHKIHIRDSDSESDSSVEVVYTQKIGRVASCAEVNRLGSGIARGKRQMTIVTSNSNVIDLSDSEFDSDVVITTDVTHRLTRAKTRSSSELDDSQLEKCPICLLPFKYQRVATTESCNHSFCLDCIAEWSKIENTCPVDRQIFNSILVRSHYNGKFIHEIPIENIQMDGCSE